VVSFVRATGKGAIQDDRWGLMEAVVLLKVSGGFGRKDPDDGGRPEPAPEIADGGDSRFGIVENPVGENFLGRSSPEPRTGIFLLVVEETNPLSPPSAPVQGRLQGPPAKSKFLAVRRSPNT